LNDIEKLIPSQKTKFQAGSHGLQAYRAQAIESYLLFLVRKDYKRVPASETAAEALGFAKKWGGQQVWQWVWTWLNNLYLPKSNCGCHIKVRTLLEDPAIKAALPSYIQ
jgi:hypothetical protein